MTLKFSIITVCFNSQATIADTLRSVASQSWHNYEHIVIDGASRDGTVALINDMADERTILVSEQDRGIYDAMNKGIARASGDIICFLNADDFYADESVLAEVAGLMTHENLDAVLSDVVFFQPDRPEKVLRRYDSGQFSPARIGYGWMPAHPGFFARRGLYEKVGPFRTDYRIAADFEWIARAFHKGDLRYRHLAKPVVRMRTGGVSTSGLKSTITLNREILRACRENGIPSNAFMLMTKFARKFMERFAR